MGIEIRDAEKNIFHARIPSLSDQDGVSANSRRPDLLSDNPQRHEQVVRRRCSEVGDAVCDLVDTVGMSVQS